jgi:hypothetical protein
MLAPGCQDLYCSGVVLVVIEEDFCLASCVCVCVSISFNLCLSGVADGWMSGGYQESVKAKCE